MWLIREVENVESAITLMVAVVSSGKIQQLIFLPGLGRIGKKLEAIPQLNSIRQMVPIRQKNRQNPVSEHQSHRLDGQTCRSIKKEVQRGILTGIDNVRHHYQFDQMLTSHFRYVSRSTSPQDQQHESSLIHYTISYIALRGRKPLRACLSNNCQNTIFCNFHNYFS